MTVENNEAPDVEGETPQEAPAELTDLEKVASEVGWKPKEQWKGDDSGWTPADEYIRTLSKREENARKAVKSGDKAFQRRVAALERTTQRALERQKTQLEAQYNTAIRQAVRDGDDDREKELRDELKATTEELDKEFEKELTPEELEEQEAQAVEDLQIPHQKLQKNFWSDHAWILSEETDLDDFRAVEEVITRKMENGSTLDEAFEAATKTMQKLNPDFYVSDEPDGEPEPRRRAPVLASASRGSSSGRSLASRLPPEAKQAAKKFIDQGLYGSYEEYAEVYQQEGGELQ